MNVDRVAAYAAVFAVVVIVAVTLWLLYVGSTITLLGDGDSVHPSFGSLRP
jgi:hypothetical protein